jgi:MFS family permease
MKAVCVYSHLILLISGSYVLPGFTETLIIIAVILAIFMLPKRLSRWSEPVRRPRRVSRLTGWQRMAILLSILWLAFLALYLKPWNNGWYIYFYAGIAPVILYWGIFWIYLGFKKKKK